MEPILLKNYREKVVPALKEVFSYKNLMEVPKINKVVVNIGYGRHTKDKPYIENITKTIETITGQKPVHNKAKKSISNFKIREGMEIGTSVTLRGRNMYEFLYKLINIALPRVRDFRGLSVKSFDKTGNFNIGLRENIAFPEVRADSVDKIHGLQIVIDTTAKNKEEGVELLKKLGFPLKDVK